MIFHRKVIYRNCLTLGDKKKMAELGSNHNTIWCRITKEHWRAIKWAQDVLMGLGKSYTNGPILCMGNISIPRYVREKRDLPALYHQLQCLQGSAWMLAQFYQWKGGKNMRLREGQDRGGMEVG